MDASHGKLVNNYSRSELSGGLQALATEAFWPSNSTTSSAVAVAGAESPDEFRWDFAFSVTLAVLLSISALLAVVGNSMVLTVVIRHRGMRTRTNLFLVNLAVADLLVGAAVMPFAITTLIEGRWIFGPTTGTFCTINGWLNCFCLVASIHTLMYISIHKHYSITQPLATHFKLRQILGMMAAAWVWAAVSSTITVTGLSSVRYKQGTSQCGPEYPDGLKSYLFHGIIQVTNIFVPAIILIYCYYRMFRAIRAHSRRLQQNSTLEQDAILAQQKKVTITLFIVLATFVICALPFHLYATYTTISKDKKHFSPYLNPMAYGSLYLNSALNPIIYAFRSPSFREGYKEILCQKPTYVISDDSAINSADHSITFRRRFSSFLDSFRISGSSSSPFLKDSQRSSFSSLASQPESLVSSSPCQRTPQARRQRLRETSGSSMSGLIRASRRSAKQSSIIRRNGHIVIVKNGKIVSVRHQPTTSHSVADGVGCLDLELSAKSPFSVSQNGSTPSDTPADNNLGRIVNNVDRGAAMASSRNSVSSVGSDSVFDEEAASTSQTMDWSPLEMISEEKRLLSQGSDDMLQLCALTDIAHLNQAKGTSQEHSLYNPWQLQSDLEIGQTHKVSETVNEKDKLLSRESDKQTKQNKTKTEMNYKTSLNVTDNKMCSETMAFSQSAVSDLPPRLGERHPTKSSDSKQVKTDVGIIIRIDEDNSILDVMPLTPATRDRITRSDLFLHLSEAESQAHSSLVPIKASKSTQGLCKRSLHRLPSVEYLDPPMRIHRTTSDFNVSKLKHAAGPKSNLKLPTANKTKRRWSLGKVLDNFAQV